jgi:hypothetical protein
VVIVPSQPKKKPSGIETRPGFSSGNQLMSMSAGSSDRFLPVGSRPLPETTGEKITSPTEEMSPP